MEAFELSAMEHHKGELLSAVCPGSANIANNTYSQWYLRFLDFHFQQLSAEEKQLLGSIDEAGDSQACFYKLLGAIAVQLTNSKPSIQNLASFISVPKVTRPTVQSGRPSHASIVASNTALHVFIFRSIGVLTMFFDLGPFHSQTGRFSLLEPLDGSGHPVQSEVFTSYQYPSGSLISLPIHQVLKHFSTEIIPASWLSEDKTSAGRPRDLFSEQLVVSYLNFRTLKKVAGIELEFVPYLGMHMEFNEESRRLKIFKYPSWCMLLATPPPPMSIYGSSLQEPETPYLASLLSAYFQTLPNEGADAWNEHGHLKLVNLCNEIILSFRLIFGEDWRSSKLFKNCYFEYYKQQRETSEEEITDPLLSDLCGAHWTALLAYQDIKLPRAKTQYSAKRDFPFLAERFLQLQRFVDDQDPSDLRTLLHDRRDVLRYWTFWGVIYVGGISILLSISQLIVGVLQLVLS